MRTHRCYLLELPPELRNYIIELYLYSVNPAKMIMVFHPFAYHETCIEQATQPHLASVNWQLRIETLSHFFAVNTVVMGSFDLPGHWDTAKRWLDANKDRLNQTKAVMMSLCSLHHVDLRIHVASGEPASCYPKCRNTSYALENCRMLRAYKEVQRNVEKLCQSVCEQGLSADDYIGIVELYLAEAPHRSCRDVEHSGSESEGTESVYSDVDIGCEDGEGRVSEEDGQDEEEILTEEGEQGAHEEVDSKDTTSQ